MTPARPLAATATGLVLTGLLAGCSNGAPVPPTAPAPARTTAATTAAETPRDDDRPTAGEAPPGTPAPTPTATRDLPRPELSDAGRTFTQDGASTFASYYVRVLNYSRNSGDTSLLKAISSPDCTACSYDVEVVEKTRELGYSHVGLNTQFIGTSHRGWDPEAGTSEMDVIVDRPAHQVVDRNGTVVTEVPELHEESFWLNLRWTAGQWQIVEAD